MELSALMDQLRSEGVKISLKPNYKKYYSEFPHIIRLENNQRVRDWARLRNMSRKVTMPLYNNLDSSLFRTRAEYDTLAIYCHDIVTVLEKISVASLKEWNNIEVGKMEETVLEESAIKPELPRAVTSVVKRLPHKKWRYRIHWATNYRTIQKIGLDAVGAIVDQINNDPNTSTFDDRTTERIKRGNYWGTPYFYTNSEDVLCIIALINPLFIKRIEKFTTLEELNEKTTS
jgi:hypothetical protein